MRKETEWRGENKKSPLRARGGGLFKPKGGKSVLCGFEYDSP